MKTGGMPRNRHGEGGKEGKRESWGAGGWRIVLVYFHTLLEYIVFLLTTWASGVEDEILEVSLAVVPAVLVLGGEGGQWRGRRVRACSRRPKAGKEGVERNTWSWLVPNRFFFSLLWYLKNWCGNHSRSILTIFCIAAAPMMQYRVNPLMCMYIYIFVFQAGADGVGARRATAADAPHDEAQRQSSVPVEEVRGFPARGQVRSRLCSAVSR